MNFTLNFSKSIYLWITILTLNVTLMKLPFWYRPIAPVSIFLLSPQSWKNAFFSSVSSVLGRRKSQRWPSPINTVIEAWLQFCFWPKTHSQLSICELVRYHDAKSMICFSTILFVSDDLLCAIGSSFHSCIPYWPNDLATRIHDAPRHCNRKKNSEQNLHIWQNLTLLFPSWLL